MPLGCTSSCSFKEWLHWDLVRQLSNALTRLAHMGWWSVHLVLDLAAVERFIVLRLLLELVGLLLLKSFLLEDWVHEVAHGMLVEEWAGHTVELLLFGRCVSKHVQDLLLLVRELRAGVFGSRSRWARSFLRPVALCYLASCKVWKVRGGTYFETWISCGSEKDFLSPGWWRQLHLPHW